jgi:hypothetical protein
MEVLVTRLVSLLLLCATACEGIDLGPGGYTVRPPRDFVDSDLDGVPEHADVCAGSDDAMDLDGDGIPNGCDTCDLLGEDFDHDEIPDVCDDCPWDNPNDSDQDGVCDVRDQCPGEDDAIDADRDGVPDACEAGAAD